jgi:large subunit ribosomal protein L4
VKLVLHKAGKKRAGRVEVADKVFAAAYNEPLVHQVITSYLSSGRSAFKSLKNRAAVRGGGKKPWRQKGLGRARAGTIRSPLWRGGGVTFANNQRNYVKKVNRKMYRGAMRSILSELVRQERLLCIDQLNISAAKTKAAVEVLAELGLEEVLIITDSISEELHLATRNLARVAVMETHEVDPYSLVGFDRVLITRPALEAVEKWLEPKTGAAEGEPEVNGHEAADAEAEDGGGENVAQS